MTLNAKDVILILLVILLIGFFIAWVFSGNRNHRKESIEKFTGTNVIQNTNLSLNEEILLVNAILSTIHYNFMIIADCSNDVQNNSSTSNVKCLKNSDKEAIYYAYKTSQTQPIEDRLKTFETLTENYRSEYGDMSGIYWDFKLLDIKNNVTLDEYYYTIVKNIVVNKIYEYVRSNMGIVPAEIKKTYPYEIPRNVIYDIVDKYFKLDINDSTIQFLGIQNAINQNAINQNAINQDAIDKPAYTNMVAPTDTKNTTLDMILSQPDKYIYNRPFVAQPESEEITISKSRGPLIQAERYN